MNEQELKQAAKELDQLEAVFKAHIERCLKLSEGMTFHEKRTFADFMAEEMAMIHNQLTDEAKR